MMPGFSSKSISAPSGRCIKKRNQENKNLNDYIYFLQQKEKKLQRTFSHCKMSLTKSWIVVVTWISAKGLANDHSSVMSRSLLIRSMSSLSGFQLPCSFLMAFIYSLSFLHAHVTSSCELKLLSWVPVKCGHTAPAAAVKGKEIPLLDVKQHFVRRCRLSYNIGLIHGEPAEPNSV